MRSARNRALLGAGAMALGVPLLLTAPGASAHGGGDAKELEGELEAVPHSAFRNHAEGEVEVERRGQRVHVELEAEDVAPDLAHLVHIHGRVQAANECPSIAADTDGNGLISIVEGAVPAPDGSPGYGPVQVSLTRFGPVDAGSGGALERMPRADEDGEIEYERMFRLPAPVTGESVGQLARSLQDMHVVVHGVDLNGNGVYDDDNPDGGDPTDAETLLPALCGALDPD